MHLHPQSAPAAGAGVGARPAIAISDVGAPPPSSTSSSSSSPASSSGATAAAALQDDMHLRSGQRRRLEGDRGDGDGEHSSLRVGDDGSGNGDDVAVQQAPHATQADLDRWGADEAPIVQSDFYYLCVPGMVSAVFDLWCMLPPPPPLVVPAAAPTAAAAATIAAWCWSCSHRCRALSRAHTVQGVDLV
jgi:hypothetical protein